MSESRAFPKIGSLFAGRTIKCVYIGSGLQLFVGGRVARVAADLFQPLLRPSGRQGAASLAALFLAICGVGMVVCGVVSDRLFSRPDQRVTLAVGYSLACAILLSAALMLPAGPAQLILLGLAIFLAAATTGPAGAMVAGLTPAAIHGTAFATLTLANNFLGLAPRPDRHRLAGRPGRPARGLAVAAAGQHSVGTGVSVRPPVFAGGSRLRGVAV